MTRQFFHQFLAEHWGKIICGLAGLIIGLTLVVFGFWKSLLIFFFVALGVFVGRMLERNENLRGVLQRFWPDSD